jgi:alkylation response protein AidB-like acyl-CoA dehydrogenase
MVISKRRQIVATRLVTLTGRAGVVVPPPGARVGEPGSGGEHDACLLDLLAVLVLGEIVGTIERAFAMTAEWVANRYSFGRPLSSRRRLPRPADCLHRRRYNRDGT